MSEQGVNLAGLRQKICLGDGFACLILADFGQEPFELLHVTIDRGAELQIGPVAPADFVECLGPAADVDPPREGIGFAAAITLPRGGGGGMIDHPRDIERNRFQPLRRLGGIGGGISRSVVYEGDPTNPATPVRGLDTIGGWSQLKFEATNTLELNAAVGLDNPTTAEVRTAGNPLLVQNRGALVNFVFRPRSSLLFSAEYRHLRTLQLNDVSNSADQFNLMMGILF